jgi:Zinc finger, C2H2 type
VIQPFSKYPEHVEKKHNTISYAKLMKHNNKIFEIVEEADGLHFICLMCDKKKHHILLFGHFIFYHNLSVHVLKKYLDMTPQIKINGSSLNTSTATAADIEDVTKKGGCKDDVCTVCDNPLDDELSKRELHGVFCRGFVVCKQCTTIFKNENLLKLHMDKEHPIVRCKFGCKETSFSPAQINEHLQNLHDITECFLCNIINSSGQFKNHLRDQHSVNLMTYEKAMSKATNKLYRAESNSQVLCNFCDKNLTKEIKEFSFINHYKDQHEITIAMILQNLDKNPIIDVILNGKNSNEDETLKNFAVVNSLENFVEADFDASKVYCIGVGHVEQKPFFIENDSSSKLICDFCNKEFDIACRLYEHLTSIHGFRLLNLDDCDECHSKWQSESSDEDSKSFNLSLVCPFDESFHVTKDHFKDHMEVEHLDDSLDVNSIIYKCIVCNYAFKNLEDIRNHFNIHHPDVKINYCKICRYKLPSNGSEDEHFSKNHAKDLEKNMKFCCKLCSKEFKKSASAKSHYKKTHHTKKSVPKRTVGQYKCHFQQCSMVFENTEDRKMHVIIEHPDEKAYKCKTCDMRFTTKGSLSSHSMKHKNLVYTCEFCAKTFTRRDSYKEHLLIHSDIRLKCSFCEKVFVQRSNLVRHERIHLQDKPYKCSYCEKTFSDKGACKSHENVHTKEESSNCPYCGKHFARKLKLKYHMRLHTLEDVVTCDICNKHFGESYSLRKHRETHDKGEKVDKVIFFIKKLAY